MRGVQEILVFMASPSSEGSGETAQSSEGSGETAQSSEGSGETTHLCSLTGAFTAHTYKVET